MPKICLVVNPVAGLGGPLGWKGTSEEEGRRLLASGVKPQSVERAARFLAALSRLCSADIVTASGFMGLEACRRVGVRCRVVYEPREWPTRSVDTRLAVEKCLEESVDVVVFVGGDGTARIVADVVKSRVPIVGVPAGVKMYSSVYGVRPEDAARAVCEYIAGRGGVCEGEVMDIDEEAFRRNVLRARLYAVVKTLCTPGMIGVSKQPSPSTLEEEENKRAIAKYVVERYFRNCTLIVLGPGSTTAAIAREAGLPKTLLGVDVYHGRSVVKLDVNESELLDILDRIVYTKAYIILTPIGGQGFVLGRGNQQITPRVVWRIGPENIVIVATWSKLRSCGFKLRVDTGDPKLDEMLRGYRRVIVDYNEEVVVRVE